MRDFREGGDPQTQGLGQRGLQGLVGCPESPGAGFPFAQDWARVQGLKVKLPS